jgi:uncharacterized protein
MIDPALTAKYQRLVSLLSELGGAVVAFSGGVDSTLLLYAAHQALSDRALAVTLETPLNPAEERDLARRLASVIGARTQVVQLDPLVLPQVATNAPDRCYHCKKMMTDALWDQAFRHGLKVVVEGSQVDDRGSHRPGLAALEQAGVRSPMAEVGLTKDDVRRLARWLGLDNWDRPAQACLATRFPYGERLTAESLHRAAEAEKWLTSQGFPGARARIHGTILRIEAPLDQLPRLTAEPLRSHAVDRLGALGFDFVTIDLAGYRSGVYDHSV